MPAKHFVYSTLSTPMTYAEYVKTGGDMHTVHKKVHINGGANVATPQSSRQLITPLGVVTQVTEEELELLKNNELFKLHVKNGFITYDTKNVDPEVRVVDMERKDDSAPITPEDFEETSDPEKVHISEKNQRKGRK